MEARLSVEFTGVELAASMEKVAAGPVEKATAGLHALEGRGGRVACGEGGRWLPRSGAVEMPASGAEAVEREAQWRASSSRQRCRALSWRYGEVSFFKSG